MYTFKLTGLSKVNGGADIVATCEPLDKEETFKATIDMPMDRKVALWDLLKNNWGGVTCRLQFDKTHNHIPQNAIVKEIFLPTT